MFFILPHSIQVILNMLQQMTSMDDISKIPRLPGDGAQDDSHCLEPTKALASSRSLSINTASDVGQG